jgi:hypothetical protein
MPARLIAGGRFFECGGQIIPARFVAGFDPYDATFCGYVDIVSHRTAPQESNFYGEELARLNPPRRGETDACLADILR